MSIVIAILIFCVIIIVHEIGHFSAARIFGMRVYSFSLGMGPTLWKKRRGDTDFCVKAIPFGGSVMVGEDDEETENDPDSFRNKPVWQRMIFILGGAFMNMVLGLVICLVIVLMNKQVDTTTIGSFYSVSVSNSQLQVGDKITNMNGMTIFTQADI
ncbi:MAG: site-2 protease family protein, partial [Oscillospiraceae bacterium]|nr:site-2 protease family protein [Oscillospiraceae bacterium]